MSVRAALRQRAHLLAPRFAGSVAALPPGRGEVALTFDDGPDPTYTPQVLDVLRDLGVPATFFFVGARAARHPDLVRRAVEEGHGVGSHTFSHPEPWALRGRALVEDYRRGRDAVQDAGGIATGLFRPPQGHLGVDEVVALRANRLACWLWTIDSEDWKPGATPASLLAASAGVGGGDVVLLHDCIEHPPTPLVVDRTATVKAVTGLVEILRARGLTPVALGRT